MNKIVEKFCVLRIQLFINIIWMIDIKHSSRPIRYLLVSFVYLLTFVI